MIIENYPGLRAAAMEIAYDNGMVNILHTEEQFLKSLDSILVGTRGLGDHDRWLRSLSNEELLTVTTGEERDMQAMMNRSPDPEGLDKLLNDIFEVQL